MAKVDKSTFETLRTSLETERSSFDSHWLDLSDYNLPRRAQFSVSDTNRGHKKNQKIINSTSAQAIRTLRSGMMGGITSPARPWFKLTTSDPALARIDAVKDWLHIVDKEMGAVFLRSNLYNALPIVYGDIGVFGTAAMLVEEDFDRVIRCYAFPIGSYSVANDGKGRVRVFFREFRMTARQVVDKFGKAEDGTIDRDNLSTHVQSLYDDKTLDAWVNVCHVITANSDYDPTALSSNKKLFRSVYYEKGSDTNGASSYVTADDSKFLSDKGYDYFPVLVPRWEVTGEDVYGTNCPGMMSLGDVKALQTMEKRKAQAIEKKINPAMVASTKLKDSKISILPGDVTFGDERAGSVLRAAHEVAISINELLDAIDKHENRISRAFFEDLFLMLAQSDRRQITATEIDERKQEKLLALGPVLEQLNQDLLDPLIDITFDIMVKQELIPQPPEELQGLALKVEYVSIMHQAQKATGLAGIDRLTSFVGEVASFDPNALDKLDIDQLINEYADITGVPPNIVRSDDQVAAIREGKAQAAAQQQQLDQISQGAVAAKDLSGADLEGNNALNALVQQSQAGATVQ